MPPITNAEQYENRVQFYVENMMAWWQGRRDQQDTATLNINAACKYPDQLDLSHFESLYIRGDIATRVNDIYPEECFKHPFEVYDDEDPEKETAFELAWQAFAEEHNVYYMLEKLDKISGIGNYAVMLIGVNDGKTLLDPIEGVDENGKPTTKVTKELQNRATSSELPKAKREVTFLRILSQAMAPIAKYQVDEASARLGQPFSYNLNLVDQGSGHMAVSAGSVVTNLSKECHWSRILHAADNTLTSEVLGTPRLENIYNRLFDIRKVMGGSAQMFWAGGFPGISYEIDPALLKEGRLPSINKDEMKKEAEAYTEGLQRFMMLVGVNAKSLAVQVADPTNHINVHIDAISIAKAIPKRILMGSEQAQLASKQDREAWNGRLKKRQNSYLTPKLVRVFVQRLIDIGVLPQPANGKFTVHWPDLDAQSDDDIAATAIKFAQALAAYANSQAAQDIMPPELFFALAFKMQPSVIREIMDAAMQAQEDAEEEAEEAAENGELDPNADPNANGVQPGATEQPGNKKPGDKSAKGPKVKVEVST